MWRMLLVVLMFGLAGCGDPPSKRFLNTEMTGADFGRELNGFRDHHGNPRTLADFRGKAVVLFFGYTSCPDVCPTTLVRLAEVMAKLGDAAGRVQVLMLTVDPQRDTPERLAAYMTGFNSSFIGLTGDQAATEAAVKEFKAFFSRGKDVHQHGKETPADVIDHTAGAYVLDSAGKIRLYLKDDASVESVASDLKRLLNERY